MLNSEVFTPMDLCFQKWINPNSYLIIYVMEYSSLTVCLSWVKDHKGQKERTLYNERRFSFSESFFPLIWVQYWVSKPLWWAISDPFRRDRPHLSCVDDFQFNLAPGLHEKYCIAHRMVIPSMFVFQEFVKNRNTMLKMSEMIM